MGEETNETELRKLDMSWSKILLHTHLHMFAVYGLYLLCTQATWSTLFLLFGLVCWGTISLTLGCHRLWAHRSYTASWPLRTFLAAGQLLVCCGSILNWATYHRLHHKHHGTDLDPHNHKKGFFYSQYISRCCNNPEQEKAQKNIDMEDLDEDNVVYYQDLFYSLIMPIFGVLIPSNYVMAQYGESLWVAIFVIGILRTTVLLNISWLIHSGYIIWGLDPLDKGSSDTWLVFFFNKSLWPQYHYLLPWDYRSGEFGTYDSGCCTTMLRVFAAIGVATGLTTISNNGVKNAMAVAAETGRPLISCLEEAKIVLPDIINQDPTNL